MLTQHSGTTGQVRGVFTRAPGYRTLTNAGADAPAHPAHTRLFEHGVTGLRYGNDRIGRYRQADRGACRETMPPAGPGREGIGGIL